MLENKLYNKCEDNFHLSNKKALFLNMRNFFESMGQDPFDALPVTFHMKNGLADPEFPKFKEHYLKVEQIVKERKALRLKMKHERQYAKEEVESPGQTPEKPKGQNVDLVDTKDKLPPPIKNIWIIKPGENTNCGNGIQVAKDYNEIISIVTESNKINPKRTCIVQRYIHNPFLIHRRKFDIRTFALFTSVGGRTKAYLYEEGYIRTSSYEYDLSNLSDRLVHLTNDAV